MPTIIGQLGGLAEYSWVFTGYLLASTTTVPLFSKLADMYGRKPIFMFGLILFVVASLTCGFATSMLQLVVFRTIQGVGAGALQPVAFTIVGDIYTPAQRAKVQGLFSAVWGGTAIIGPAIGGVITTTVGWPWVFWINLPIGIIAAVAFMRIFKEKFERVPHKLDLLGAFLLTAGVALLLFALSEGGAVFGYSSPQFLGHGVALDPDHPRLPGRRTNREGAADRLHAARHPGHPVRPCDRRPHRRGDVWIDDLCAAAHPGRRGRRRRSRRALPCRRCRSAGRSAR